MFSFLKYLIALVIASHGLPQPGAPAPEPKWALIATVLAGFGLVAAFAGTWIRGQAEHAPEAAARRYDRAQSCGDFAVILLFWVLAQTLDGRMLPAAAGLGNWVLVPHVLRLVPFALLIVLLRAGLHSAGVRLGVEPRSVVSALLAEVRQATLPLAPIAPLLVAWDVVLLADPASRLGALREVLLRLPVLQAFVSLGLLFCALLAMPFLLRLAWGAKPLPPCELRTRLEAYAARVGLRARDFLVWPTDHTTHNAAVVGPLARFRYVVLTDALLEDLGADEVEAVVAHEAGHARRGHILLFFGFSAVLVFASVLPRSFGTSLAGPLTALDPLVRSVLMIVVWLGVVLGWISRRFEQEADVYGIETIELRPGPDGSAPSAADHPFARALERIAAETGEIREVTGWRHFSIADRVDFVRRYVADPAVRARYRRSIGLLRGTLLTVVFGAAFLAAVHVPGELQAAGRIWDMARDPAAQVLAPLRLAQQPLPPQVTAGALLQAAQLATRAGEPDAALRWLREAAARAPGEPVVLMAYAGALEAAGRPRGAEVAWRDVLAVPNLPVPVANQARDALARLADETP